MKTLIELALMPLIIVLLCAIGGTAAYWRFSPAGPLLLFVGAVLMIGWIAQHADEE